MYVTEYKTCNKKQDSFVIHWQKVSIWSLTWAVKLLYKKTWRRRKYMYWNAVYATKDDMGGFIFLVTLFSIKKEWEKLWKSYIFSFLLWLPYEKIMSLKEAGKLIWYKYLNTSFTQPDCPYRMREHATIWKIDMILSLVFINSSTDAKVSQFW